MKIHFLPPAQQELDDAVTWYNQQVPELGLEFLDELDKALRRIDVYPASCEEISPGLRRCLLARFPYGLIYGVDNETKIIVAVAHLHRQPRYWLERSTKKQ